MLSFENQAAASPIDIEAERNMHTLRAYEMSTSEYGINTSVDLSSVGWSWLDTAMHLRARSPDISHLPILEIGSATGRDAAYIEDRYGASVMRTDATTTFVDRLRSQGHEAHVLNALTDDLGGPYSMIFANGVVSHFSEKQAMDFISRAVDSLVRGGVLAFSVKTTMGWDDQEGWDVMAPPSTLDTLTRKIQPPRYNYIRSPLKAYSMIRRAMLHDKPPSRAGLCQAVPYISDRSHWSGIIARRLLRNEAYSDDRSNEQLVRDILCI